MTLFLYKVTHKYKFNTGDTVRNLVSILLLGFLCQIFLLDPSASRASSFDLSSISVKGNNRLSDAAIVNYSRLAPQKNVSSEDLTKAYSRIFDTGLFKSVAFKQVDRTLIITVEEYPTVNEISFEGNKKFTDEKLSSAVSIKPRFVFTPSILEENISTLQGLYRNVGRTNARIQSKIIKLSDNRVNVIFEIFEGKAVEIEKINFVGNRVFSDGRLRRVLTSKQAGYLRKVINRDNFIKERLPLDKKLLREFYLERGFANFKINDVNVELSEEKDGFFITYNIQEGPQFKIGQVNLTSNVKEIASASLQKFVKVRTGDTFSPSALQSTTSTLDDQVVKLGHDFIRVSTSTSKNLSNLTIDITLTFEKAAPLFVERIDISGNTATLDKVVRGKFEIVEGDPFNPRQVRAAAERIRKMGIFSDSKVSTKAGSDPSKVIIEVDVVEMPTGSLTFGAGYSSAAGLGGIIEYGERNFLGRGQSLSFAVKTGKDDQLYEFSFYEPMFIRNDLGFGVNASFKDTNQKNAAYDTGNVKFQPYISYPLGEKSKIKIEYAISRTKLTNPGNVGTLISDEVNEGQVTSSSISYLYSHDTRLFKSGPKNGFIFNLGQEFIGFGGDKTGLKTSLAAIGQRDAFQEEVKLSAVLEAGVLTFTEGNSRVTDRFFLSSRKMRGFKPDGLGPRECPNKNCDSSFNDALGGENYAVLRLEAEFPLGLPEEYGLSGGLFYDIGNLWSLKKVNADVLYEEGAWRHAIGASIFWKTPIGPLRFNFSDALQKEFYDKDESFDFTISTRF